jgi:hypothetical protein
MKVLQYECTVCHGVKREGNRWLIGKVWDGYVGLRPWSSAQAVNDEADAHLCTDQCALIWQQRKLMEKGR